MTANATSSITESLFHSSLLNTTTSGAKSLYTNVGYMAFLKKILVSCPRGLWEMGSLVCNPPPLVWITYMLFIYENNQHFQPRLNEQVHVCDAPSEEDTMTNQLLLTFTGRWHLHAHIYLSKCLFSCCHISQATARSTHTTFNYYWIMSLWTYCIRAARLVVHGWPLPGLLPTFMLSTTSQECQPGSFTTRSQHSKVNRLNVLNR